MQILAHRFTTTNATITSTILEEDRPRTILFENNTLPLYRPRQLSVTSDRELRRTFPIPRSTVADTRLRESVRRRPMSLPPDLLEARRQNIRSAVRSIHNHTSEAAPLRNRNESSRELPDMMSTKTGTISPASRTVPETMAERPMRGSRRDTITMETVENPSTDVASGHDPMTKGTISTRSRPVENLSRS